MSAEMEDGAGLAAREHVTLQAPPLERAGSAAKRTFRTRLDTLLGNVGIVTSLSEERRRFRRLLRELTRAGQKRDEAAAEKLLFELRVELPRSLAAKAGEFYAPFVASTLGRRSARRELARAEAELNELLAHLRALCETAVASDEFAATLKELCVAFAVNCARDRHRLRVCRRLLSSAVLVEWGHRFDERKRARKRSLPRKRKPTWTESPVWA